MPRVTGRSLPLSGVFAIDKPRGVLTMKLLNSINELLASSELFLPSEAQEGHRRDSNKRFKKPRRFGKVKLGQGGTLDPLASGVLVLGVNDGTKMLSGFLNGAKEYRATGLLGSATDTYDAEGKIMRRDRFHHVTKQSIEACLPHFRGKIKQLPPIYSALKMDGKPLYDYARSNTPLPRPIEARDVTVYNLQLLRWQEGAQHSWSPPCDELTEEEKANLHRLKSLVDAAASSEAEKPMQPSNVTKDEQKGIDSISQGSQAFPPAFDLQMSVSSGTYVRTIVHDIGAAVGSCAHVVELIRTRQGQFALDPDNVSRTATETDTGPIHRVLPWSMFEAGITDLRNGNKDRIDAIEQDELLPWEKAIMDALQTC